MKIDFVTDFVSFKYFKYENIEKSKKLLDDEVISTITHSDNTFIVDIDYKRFTPDFKKLITLHHKIK